MRASVLSLFLLLGCSKTQAAPTPPPAEAAVPVAVVADAVPAVDAAPPSRAMVATGSYAHFEGSQLFECVDVTVDYLRPEDAGTDWKPKDDPVAVLMKDQKSSARITRPCAEQFADRIVLGTCVATLSEKNARSKKGKDAGWTPGLAITYSSSFFDFGDVGVNDARMAECMKLGGDWKGLARDSVEWHKAKLDHDRKRLGKAVDKLNEGAE
jgi:hypothetical protein